MARSLCRNILDALLDFFFPPRCPSCRAYVENRGEWCDACLSQTVNPRFVALTAENYGELDGAWAMGKYQGALKKLIAALKYRLLTEETAFIHSFTLAADENLVLPPLDMAVAVPLHRERQRERGFNQVEMIFSAWLQKRNLPLEKILVRQRATRRQFLLKPQERRENMIDAFAVAPNMERKIEGSNILLLDDIMTTGSTLRECAKTLKKAKAKSVYALVLASDNI